MKSGEGQFAGARSAASAHGHGGAAATPLRVLHIVAAGEYGGAEAQVLDVIEGLLAMGVPVAVAALFDGEFAKKARDAGVEVHILAGAPWRDFGALLRLVRQWRPQLLHTHGVRASVAGRLVGVRAGVPVVTTVHSDLYHDYAAPAKRALFMALELATQELSVRVIAVSRPLADILRKRGYAARKLSVVENGIDVRAFDAQLADAAQADAATAHMRRELELPDGALVVVCVARLHPVKLHDVLIRAVGGLGASMDDVHLALVGDGSERAALQALAAEAAPGRVHFLGARSDVPALLSQADIFALTSRMEGMPISVLEAMAARLPVVASRAGGLVELVADAGAVAADRTAVQDAPTGFLFEPGSVDGLRAALSILLRDAGLRRALGEAGRERLLARFTTERMVQGTMDVYRLAASGVNLTVV